MRRAFLCSARALVVAALVVSCGNGSGGRCAGPTECQAGLVCVSASAPGRDGGGADQEVRLCMRQCDYDAGDGVEQRLCSDGAVCLPFQGMRVCYLGGNHPLGSTCADDIQCEAGTVCAGDTGLCNQACTVGNDMPCDAGETCIAVSGGICRVVSSVPDGSSDVDGGLDGSP